MELKRTKFPKKARFAKAVHNIDAIKAERCRRSFYYFIQEFWDVVSNDKLVLNWHIKYLADELQEIAERVAQGLPKKNDLIINISPGTTKSTIVTIMFPDWCWIRWHWFRFICGSYSAQLSLEHAEYGRDIVKSKKFKVYFPELQIKQDKDTKSNFRVTRTSWDSTIGQNVTVLGGNRYATSVGGTVTGFHGHILIVDDPLNPQQAVSAVELKNANDWFDKTLSTRKIDKQVTPTIVIMQRLHENDVTGHLLAKNKKNIKHICLPGEIKNYREQVKPKELIQFYKDDLFDPVRMGWSALKDLEADLGQYGYAGQIGQDPAPPTGGMFKVDHFQIVQTLPAPVNFMKIVRYWDKAGTADGGAYTVGVKMIKLTNGKYLIVDVKRGQWSTEEREKIIRETAEADGSQVHVYIEQEPGSGGKESAQSTISNLAGYVCIADRPTGDKIFRADPLSVQVNNGNVLLLQGDWNYDYIEEFRFFPYTKYKDQVDATSGSFSKLVQGKVARVLV